ncbi:gluconokinase [Dolichospermum sp. UHCC 0684]|jgi:gluconokinase|uniref:gluconokinase n=1 Tax=unclassified Dolichospermum TaxID=2622029 RepID=UPI0015803F96|nr:MULTISPECIES: gluconokinase [unclassified Dolichospermum]MBS9391526.1 gluconokinase [Dolichospermum sp. WA123]MEA5531182.1 gluconokinase [Dolichospermum sp. UHCC 0684]
MIVILMGVAGSGKTTIGQALAAATGWEFSDADWFHSAAAKEKMNRGEPLTDTDRAPWLQTMREAIAQWLQADKNAILACSALKVSYRQILCYDDPRVKLVYLQGSYGLIEQRLRDRIGHFMKADLLQSQFETLEEPTAAEAIYIDISQNLEAIIQEIKDYL